MKRYAFLLLFLVELLACKRKNMTLEELKEATWSKLDNGVEYINLKKGKADPSDSIRFSVKGFWGSNIAVPADVYNEMQPTLDTSLGEILNNKLSESKRGYLKINLYEMTSPEFLTATASLYDNDDSIELNKGITKIREIKGVVDATYISKDMAKKNI